MVSRAARARHAGGAGPRGRAGARIRRAESRRARRRRGRRASEPQWAVVAGASALSRLTRAPPRRLHRRRRRSWQPGAAGVRDPLFHKLGNGGYDVQHYALTLHYDPATNRLEGTAEITARATQDLSAFNLDLHGLTVESAAVDGKKAAANRAGDELTVRPHRDLDKGKTFRTVVRYSGTPEVIVDKDKDESEEGWLTTADGALAVGEPAGSMAWFPGNNHPSDKATYDITVTVPKGLQAISNGELTSRRTAGDRTTFAWKSKEPMASYLATLAIGKYDVKRSSPASGPSVLTAVDKTVADDSEECARGSPRSWNGRSSTSARTPSPPSARSLCPTDEVGYALETQSRPVFPRSTSTPRRSSMRSPTSGTATP